MSRVRVPRRRTALLVTMVIMAAASPIHVAPAQDAFDAKSAAHLRDQYLNDMDTVHAKITALANAIPAAKYGWRPAPGVRSISEVLMHIVGEWYFYGPRSIGGKEPADFGDPKTKLPGLERTVDKAAVLAELDKSWAYCKAQMQAASPAALTGKYQPWGVTLDQAAFDMTGDQHEHLGQLIAYARSVGVVPPWSK